MKNSEDNTLVTPEDNNPSCMTNVRYEPGSIPTTMSKCYNSSMRRKALHGLWGN